MWGGGKKTQSAWAKVRMSMVDAWLLQERRLGNMEVGLWGIANISSNNRVFALLLS